MLKRLELFMENSPALITRKLDQLSLEQCRKIDDMFCSAGFFVEKNLPVQVKPSKSMDRALMTASNTRPGLKDLAELVQLTWLK